MDWGPGSRFTSCLHVERTTRKVVAMNMTFEKLQVETKFTISSSHRASVGPVSAVNVDLAEFVSFQLPEVSSQEIAANVIADT